MKAHFSKLNACEKSLFVERYVTKIVDKYKTLNARDLPLLPDDVATRAKTEIDINRTDNIRILKNETRSWLSSLVEKLRKMNGQESPLSDEP